MPDRPQFRVPELPSGLFEARTTPAVSVVTVDSALDKATPHWPGITRTEVELALSTDWAAEDPSRAVDLLQYYFDAASGNVVSIGGDRRAYSGSSVLHHTLNLLSLSRPVSKSPKLHEMRGAANYGGVTCYISSTLSAMFSRLENFEPLLHQKFDDTDVNLLATWLRIFVNMLRSGEIISKDILRALLACSYNLGWTQSGQGGPNHQQDAGEFFTFLTDVLHMPLLSLRVDIAHAGREVAEDDHKLVTEQLLFLPIPDGEGPILLEECLELYFSDIISVSRPCNRADKVVDRRPTFSSTSTALSNTNTGELSNAPRRRAYSIVSQVTQPHSRRIELDELLPSDSPTMSRRRRSSLTDTLLPTYTQLFGDTKEVIDKKNQLWTNNNEITFPAWMFYQLMPFYARSQDSEKLKNLEAQQVASHFEKTRPVLAMCLKRFGMDDNGNQILKTRKVIIPHTINLPSFVADDTDMEHAFGNFKLVLESVVFHKGPTNHSGHYTSLVREEFFNNNSSSSLTIPVSSQKGIWRRRSKRERSQHSNISTEDEIPERWLLFDDQAPDSEKVQVVNFTSAMDNNMPYLLFYRMVALDEDPCENPKSGSLHPDLSPVLSPSNSTPVSPRMLPVDVHSQTPIGTMQIQGIIKNGNSSDHWSHSSSAQSPNSQSNSHTNTTQNSSHNYPNGPIEEKKKRSKNIFSRKHRDKDYARAYREEKCKVM